MKKLLYLLLLPIFLFACKSDTKQPVKNSLLKTKTTDLGITLFDEFDSVANGIWVKTDYIEDVVKTQSPYASREKLNGIASLYIGKEQNLRDSMIIGASFNNHEGYSFPLYFKAGKKANSFKSGLPDFNVESNTYELGYSINSQDTSLILYHYNKQGHLLNSTKFSKVYDSAPPEDDMGFGIEYIVHQKLIAGKYTFTDTTGAAIDIEFTKDGKVNGFLNFKAYSVNTDYVAGPENDLDQIYFDVYKKNQQQYLFRLKRDTLNLFEVAESPDSVHLKWGKLKYQMIKKQ